MEHCQLIMEEQQLLIRHQAQQSSWAWLKRKKKATKQKTQRSHPKIENGSTVMKKREMFSYMKNGQLQEYPRPLQSDMCWPLLPRYLPDQAVSVEQDGRRLRLSQVLIPKENKQGPSFAWATEHEGRLVSGF